MSEFAVVGAGIVGLSAAVALGGDVTVYERAAPGAGQSAGESRIFRHVHDDPRLVGLALESRALWRAWEERFGVELLAADGVVVLGRDEPAALRAAGVRTRALPAGEALPLLGDRAGDAWEDCDGGVIRPLAAIGALAGALGDAIVREEVLSVRPTPAGTVEVRAGGGVFEHARVIVCAGRGTAQLAAGIGLALPVQESAHVRLTFPVRGAAPGALACLLDGLGGAYGDPLPGNAHYAVGLDDVPAGDGGSVSAAALAAAERRVVAYVASRLPGLSPGPVASRHCWVTALPWSHDGIAVWEVDGLAFLAGNNLFKHAPSVGGALAAAARGEGLAPALRPDARLGVGGYNGGMRAPSDRGRWTVLGALTPEPTSTSDLYDRIGYPELLRGGLIQYDAFRNTLVALAADGLAMHATDEDGASVWRLAEPPDY